MPRPSRPYSRNAASREVRPRETSVDTSKPTSDRRFKTGQRGRGVETGSSLSRRVLLGQAGRPGQRSQNLDSTRCRGSPPLIDSTSLSLRQWRCRVARWLALRDRAPSSSACASPERARQRASMISSNVMVLVGAARRGRVLAEVARGLCLPGRLRGARSRSKTKSEGPYPGSMVRRTFDVCARRSFRPHVQLSRSPSSRASTGSTRTWRPMQRWSPICFVFQRPRRRGCWTSCRRRATSRARRGRCSKARGHPGASGAVQGVRRAPFEACGGALTALLATAGCGPVTAPRPVGVRPPRRTRCSACEADAVVRVDRRPGQRFARATIADSVGGKP